MSRVSYALVVFAVLVFLAGHYNPNTGWSFGLDNTVLGYVLKNI